MCRQCGRPQPATAAGRCSACGELLPEAPLPSVPPVEPFLRAELGGGRLLVGEGARLAFHPYAHSAPFLVELDRLRRMVLVRQPLHAAFGVTVLAVLALAAVPWPLARVLLGLLALGSAVLGAVGLRYELRLESSSGVELRWGLGLVRRGSQAEQRVRQAWSSLTPVLREHGVSAQESPASPSSPGA